MGQERGQVDDIYICMTEEHWNKYIFIFSTVWRVSMCWSNLEFLPLFFLFFWSVVASIHQVCGLNSLAVTCCYPLLPPTSNLLPLPLLGLSTLPKAINWHSMQFARSQRLCQNSASRLRSGERRSFKWLCRIADTLFYVYITTSFSSTQILRIF